MPDAIYRCHSCHERVTGQQPEPTTWVHNQRQVPRLLCPKCGGACAPEGWLLVALQACSQHAHQGMHIDALEAFLWSACPNALACRTVGTYAGDCERAQSVMPKCLAAVHSRIAGTEHRLQALERTASGGRREPLQGPTPTSTNPGTTPAAPHRPGGTPTVPA